MAHLGLDVLVALQWKRRRLQRADPVQFCRHFKLLRERSWFPATVAHTPAAGFVSQADVAARMREMWR